MFLGSFNIQGLLHITKKTHSVNIIGNRNEIKAIYIYFDTKMLYSLQSRSSYQRILSLGRILRNQLSQWCSRDIKRNPLTFMMSASSRMRFGLYSLVCTLHYLIIIMVQTYLKTLNLKNAFQIYLSNVWVRFSIFSQLSILQKWGCVFSVYPFPLWWL